MHSGPVCIAGGGELWGVCEAMFPEDALAGKPVDGRGNHPGISVGSEETGTESINDDNNGTWHRGPAS